jgi:hypothetical protein
LATSDHTESPNCLIGSTIVFVILLDCIAAIIAIRKTTTQKIFKNNAQINQPTVSKIPQEYQVHSVVLLTDFFN